MSDSEEIEDNEPQGLAVTRSRRSKADKTGRLAALEKLRKLKGQGAKNKYEVQEVSNVYDIVDEDTYSRTVQERLENNFIVEDGSGYYENGEEIFEESDEDEKISKKSEKPKKPKLSKAEKDLQKNKYHSVRNMLMSMTSSASKRKREDNSESVSTKDDELLGDLMNELHEEKKVKITPGSSKNIDRLKFGESLLEKSKIKEDKPFLSQKNTQKKKFVAFKIPEVKSEPVDIPADLLLDDGEDVFMTSIAFDHSDSAQDINEVEAKKEIPENLNVCNDISSSECNVNEVSVTMGNEGKREPLDKIQNDLLSDQRFNTKSTSEAFLNAAIDKENDSTWDTDQISDLSLLSLSADASAEALEEIKIFWLDLCEEPKNPGVLYIFGKVRQGHQFQSCCLVVKDLQRCMYFLPGSSSKDKEYKENQVAGNDANSMLAVYEEVGEILNKRKIDSFKSRSAKKRYCFDDGSSDLLIEREYLEVRYSGVYPPLPSDLVGKTFCRVFGTSNPLLETFLLEKKFKGPSWLIVKNATKVLSEHQQSYCRFEFTCSVKDVELHVSEKDLPIPPVILLSLNVQSYHDQSSKKDILTFIGMTVTRQFRIDKPTFSQEQYNDWICLLNKPPGEVWPFDIGNILTNQVIRTDSERAMLSQFVAKIQQIDPDIYLGHDMNFELLLLKLLEHKVPKWSRIGRLKRNSPSTKSHSKILDTRSAHAGRLLCDMKISAMELIRARSYDLQNLASQVLHVKEDNLYSITGADVKEMFSSSIGINQYYTWGMTICLYCLQLCNVLQVIPLAVQITTLAGNTLSQTLLGGRAKRNEYLLLHAFHNKGFIVPEKFRSLILKGKHTEKDDGKSGPSYVGGLVLEPKKGFYDDFIVLMDFNSLYPSIIQEYDVCFTTASGLQLSLEDNIDKSESKKKSPGILPDEIRKLVETRKAVKSLMKDESISEETRKQYDIRQKALKLTANSMYGCLGFRNSRFYAKELASFITGKGREILTKTKDSVEKMNFEVIYGDTDSIMINTSSKDIDKVFQIGNKIKTEINKTYKLLELEIDGVFRYLLLLKKKKYAALVYNKKSDGTAETALELKGLDMVRRDWAPVAASTAKLVLDKIMSDNDIDTKVYGILNTLEAKAKELNDGEIPINDLLITKQLAKNPEEYKDAQGLFHVQVALRMNKSGLLSKPLRNGDTVSYLFCNDGLPHHKIELINQRKDKAVSVKQENSCDLKNEEIGEDGETKPLVPSAHYYLANQIHPVVSRICEPIAGLDGACIAEALGLDPSNYKKKHYIEDSIEDKYLGVQSEEDKYRYCQRFSFVCPTAECKNIIYLESLFSGTESSILLTLTTVCSQCNEKFCSDDLKLMNVFNQFTLFCRSFVTKAYQNEYICEEVTCSAKTRRVPLQLVQGKIRCPSCRSSLMRQCYSTMDFSNQINYLNFAVDFDKQLDKLPGKEKEVIRSLLASEDMSRVKAIYSRMKIFVQNMLSQCSFDKLDLGILFGMLYSTASSGGRNKLNWKEESSLSNNNNPSQFSDEEFLDDD